MRRLLLPAVAAALLTGLPARADTPFPEARKGFSTTFQEDRPKGAPLPKPPKGVAHVVRYPSPAGSLAAYVTDAPPGPGKHPAIVWISGGDPNTEDDGVFAKQPAENDQSARQYREAGVITMYPTLRGGNDNPGRREGFFGEVDDVIAAADFLAKQPGVDPDRIYLGGHSTGATLVLLVAEATPRFRAAFAFGPAENAAMHQPSNVPIPEPRNPTEMPFRMPVRWLDSVQSPLFVFEGASGPISNIESLQVLQKATSNPQIRFFGIPGANHFSDLAPTNALIAKKIAQDSGPSTNIAFTPEELNAPFSR